MISVITECLNGSCVSVVTYAKIPSPVGVEEKLKGQGFHHAAVRGRPGFGEGCVIKLDKLVS